MHAIPKKERLAGYFAALKYMHVLRENAPATAVILMVNAILRAAAAVRKQ